MQGQCINLVLSCFSLSSNRNITLPAATEFFMLPAGPELLDILYICIEIIPLQSLQSRRLNESLPSTWTHTMFLNFAVWPCVKLWFWISIIKQSRWQWWLSAHFLLAYSQIPWNISMDSTMTVYYTDMSIVKQSVTLHKNTPANKENEHLSTKWSFRLQLPLSVINHVQSTIFGIIMKHQSNHVSWHLPKIPQPRNDRRFHHELGQAGRCLVLANLSEDWLHTQSCCKSLVPSVISCTVISPCLSNLCGFSRSSLLIGTSQYLVFHLPSGDEISQKLKTIHAGASWLGHPSAISTSNSSIDLLSFLSRNTDSISLAQHLASGMNPVSTSPYNVTVASDTLPTSHRPINSMFDAA